MARHIVSTTTRCPRCGSNGSRTHIAESRLDGIRFSSSFQCPTCSLAEEADGQDLPDEAREAFCAAEGRWSLVVRDLGAHPVEALRALRVAREGEPAELLRLVRDGTSIVEGALVEVERIEPLLTKAGAKTVVARLSEASATASKE